MDSSLPPHANGRQRTLINALLGAFPVLGVVTDSAFKANIRNSAIFEEFLKNQSGPVSSSMSNLSRQPIAAVLPVYKLQGLHPQFSICIGPDLAARSVDRRKQAVAPSPEISVVSAFFRTERHLSLGRVCSRSLSEVLQRSSGLVGIDDDARRQSLRAIQRKCARRSSLPKNALPFAQQDRID